MNSNLDPILFLGGVFAASTMVALIILQAVGVWWQERASQKKLSMSPQSSPHADAADAKWATYLLIAVLGMGLVFLIVKDSEWTPLTLFGIFATAPYAYLEKKRAERKTWLTRSSVARGLDEIQVLTESHTEKEQTVLDAHPWLEKSLKRNTFFQKFDARLLDLAGQGLALRGSKTDLEKIARALGSEDLFQFIRRAWGDNEEDRTAFLAAADTVSERVYLDAESSALRMMGQMVWLWFGLLAALGAAVLLSLGAN